jgi:16S rRNA C967 or C1407 C5-methylase (RsmB/RsmF family)/NOL1/NOP2/fmu family ribosome biogenesis protein
MESTHVPLPSDFIRRIEADYLDAELLLDALNDVPPVSIRLHPTKGTSPFGSLAKVPWCESGIYLGQRPVFTLDPLFHAGGYYPQEAGSMLLHHILHSLTLPEAPILLDLCAAPGGKSTIAMDFLQNRGLLISNEIIRNRAYILRDNLSKWGGSQVVVTNNAPEDFSSLGGVFDAVIVDAPCSGEGMFRKDWNARSEWSLENVQICATRQASILEQIAPTIKYGGYLIYSTCTFNTDENELQVQRLVDSGEFEHVQITMDEQWGFTPGKNQLGTYAFPHKTKGEGFYSCVLKRTRPTDFCWGLSNKQRKQFGKFTVPASIAEVTWQNHGTVIEKAGNLFAWPVTVPDVVQYALLELNCVKWGTRLGELIKGKLIPNQELAWDTALNEKFYQMELSLDMALRFLKGEPIPVQGQEGWLLVTYQGLPLGWLKAMRNRSNNYYPKELRIRMAI